MSLSLPAALDAAVAAQDLPALQRAYREQDEFAVVEHFLPPTVIEQWTRELEALKPRIHRNFIPRHKQGGSVAYDTVAALAPTITGVYRDPRFRRFLADIAGAPMNECPPSDPHRCALYAYTQEGDHIGWHYDTSYYKDRRWTVLVGLVDRSSARLLCDLHTKNPGHEVEKRELAVGPGTVVLFNGDKLWHCVTPARAGEERYIVSMQYVTTGDMNPFLRFVSNMKDAIAYFGFKRVFFGTGKMQPAPGADR